MTSFENKTCGRCDGTGRYSWNAMHGSMCYGCEGKGFKLTKRGAAAYNHLLALLSAPVSDLKVGMTIHMSGKFRTIESITEDTLNVGLVVIDTKTMSWHAHPTDTVRVAHTAEEKAEALVKALEFQATLTASGTPRKTRKAA